MSGPERLAEFSLPDEGATRTLAAAVAAGCKPGDCLLLRGELGTGKTTFARGFIQALQEAPEEVVSPTFTLVQSYPGRIPVWHFDLYRLRKREEAMEIGLEEALQSGITLIEWPELVEGDMPASALDVAIRLGNNASERAITFTGLPQAWQSRLKL